MASPILAETVRSGTDEDADGKPRQTNDTSCSRSKQEEPPKHSHIQHKSHLANVLDPRVDAGADSATDRTKASALEPLKVQSGDDTSNIPGIGNKLG